MSKPMFRKIMIDPVDFFVITLARLVDNGVNVLLRFCLLVNSLDKRIANPLVTSLKSVINFCFFIFCFI